MANVRIAVIGAGWWATTNHIPLLAADPRVELSAVCRLGLNELAKVQREFGFEYATESVSDLFEHGHYDGVVVVSPHHLHFDHAVRALNARAHVMVEKPMTTDAAQAAELVRLSHEVGREILVPHGWNFQPYVERAREMIAAHAIGNVLHASLQMASPAEALFSGSPYPGTEGHMFRPPESTWADPKNFGGYGWGQFPHVLGCLFWIAPELRGKEVFALSRPSPTGVDLFDAVSIRFSSGATASLSGAGTVPMNSRFQVDIRLFGTEGMLLLDMERERLVVRRNDDRNEEYQMESGSGDYTCVEPVKRFIDICAGEVVLNSGPGDVAQKATEVVDAMYRSIDSGKLEAIQ